ncbi:hypothetical protein GOP47_0025361 [Adiantum capillus-veneris]|uniref:Uncharacterized protein n=1 Tax=Adiantum capillus-veneris TaxID=13818 RepID=A0A9D4U0M6_ADICA|nr:hypothetical protein GOP47_0025361 [Adiantum capillus-veneris]
MASSDPWDPPTPRPGMWAASSSPLPSGTPATPQTIAPSRNISRSSSWRYETSKTGSRSRSCGSSGGCCGGAADGVVHSTAPSLARSTHRRLNPCPTHTRHSYLCEVDGSVVRNAEGEHLEILMRDITWNAFRHDLLTNWKSIPKERKEYVLAALHDEFPQPNHDVCFNNAIMMRSIGVLLHCRSEVHDAYKEDRNQPNWVDNEMWGRIKAERDGNPQLFQQQVDAGT